MSIEELIKELRKEQRKRAKELLDKSSIKDRKEALKRAGKLEVCILNMGPVGEVCRETVIVGGRWAEERISLSVEEE